MSVDVTSDGAASPPTPDAERPRPRRRRRRAAARRAAGRCSAPCCARTGAPLVGARAAAAAERRRDGRALPGQGRHRPRHPAAAARRRRPTVLVAVAIAFVVATVVEYLDQARVPRRDRAHRSGRAARPAHPGVRPLPAAVRRLPRALHVGSGDLPADQRRRRDRRAARRRHRRPGGRRRCRSSRSAVILLFLDLPLGLVTLLSFPFLLWLSRWFRRNSARRLPADPRDGRAGHRALRRVARRHPRGAGVPPRAAQPGDLRGAQLRLPRGQPSALPADRHLRPGHQADRQRHRSRSCWSTAATA